MMVLWLKMFLLPSLADPASLSWTLPSISDIDLPVPVLSLLYFYPH